MHTNSFFRLFLLMILIINLTSCNSGKKKEEKEPITISSGKSSDSKMASSSKYEEGKKIYSNICITCHMSNGQGIEGNFPPLDGSNWLTEKRKESIHAVKYGLNGTIQVNGTEYSNVMPSPQLTDEQVAQVMNYVMHSWENSADNEVTLEEVQSVSKQQ